jgi:hypothetical protein
MGAERAPLTGQLIPPLVSAAGEAELLDELVKGFGAERGRSAEHAHEGARVPAEDIRVREGVSSISRRSEARSRVPGQEFSLRNDGHPDGFGGCPHQSPATARADR